MRNELTKTYGDFSHSFSFKMLFPKLIRFPIEKIEKMIYNLVNRSGCLKRVFRSDRRGDGPLHARNPLSRSSKIERTKAMRTLEEKLGNIMKEGRMKTNGISRPSCEEEETLMARSNDDLGDIEDIRLEKEINYI